MRVVLPAGVKLIKDYEGLKLKAYRDTGGVLTIGYGHTGSDVTPGLVISMARAEELFAGDLRRMAASVSSLVPTVTDTQFSALVSFAYNVGPDIDADTKAEGLGDSTLLRKHLVGDYAGAAREFGKWIHDNGRILPGLVKRRAAEAALYSTPGRPI